MKKFFLIISAIALIGVLIFDSYTKPAIAKELKIGSLSVLTGPGSPGISPQDVFGVHGAADWINSKGGLTINGEKYLIKVITEDTKDSTAGMVAAANKLVYKDKVKFILNCTPSLSILKAVLPMLKENKVIVFNGEGLGVREYISPDSTYEFHSPMCTSAYMSSINAFKKLYPEVKTLVSMTTEGDEFQKEVIQIEEALALDPQGPRIISYGTYPMGSSDYYPTWTKVLSSPKKPDGIIMCMGIAHWYAGVKKQGGELGFNKPFVGMGLGCDPYIVADLAGKYATDMLLACFDFKSPEMPPDIKEAVKFLKDKYNQEMTAAIYIGWEQMVILADVIKQAQSLDSTVVRDFWEKMTVINTPVGPGRMAGQKYYGTNHVVIRSMPMCRIMDGKVSHYGWGDGSLAPVQ
ncbi:ABC transporter substrate-binding protein [Thermodesulfobacteriota bacterium]